MQGVVNRAIQCFVRDTYGWPVWLNIVERAGLDFNNFEAMLYYDPSLTQRVVAALEQEFNRPRASVLEDLGMYLVTHPTTEAVRRLLRFGGDSFEDFILSLDELPARARLALQDLKLPEISLQRIGPKHYDIRIGPELPGFSCVLCGTLHAMADDYGALAFIEHTLAGDGGKISVVLADDSFAEGRNFQLAPVFHEAG